MLAWHITLCIADVPAGVQISVSGTVLWEAMVNIFVEMEVWFDVLMLLRKPPLHTHMSQPPNIITSTPTSFSMKAAETSSDAVKRRRVSLQSAEGIEGGQW